MCLIGGVNWRLYWPNYWSLYLSSVKCQESVESQSIYWLSGVLLSVNRTTNSWSWEHWFCIGNVSLSHSLSIGISCVPVNNWQCLYNSSFSNFVPKAFPFVTRYLSTDTHGNFFAHYTYRLWLISACSDTKSQSIFMYRPTSPSSVGWHTCTGCYIGWESVNSWLTDSSNDSRLRFRPLCQLSVSDKLVICRQSNDWLSTNRL